MNIMLAIYVCQGLILALLVKHGTSSQPCFNRFMPDIPSDHSFNKIKKPAIIGHRGQPRIFQENTLEGVKSLVELGADGFEIDIFLTNYGQLVVFHDVNTFKLTGVNRTIWEMTPSEIKDLKYKDTLTYGKLQYRYPSRLKVALLEDILNATRDTKLFMYLEMKPGNFLFDPQHSARTGKAVAQMVTRLGLEKRVFLVSFDPHKSHAAKQENPNLVVGTFYDEDYWNEGTTAMYTQMKRSLETLPGLKQCLGSLSPDRSYIDFLFEKGSIFKSINASFVDMQYTIYDNPNFSNNTFSTLRKNYNPKISAGAWTIYSMKLTASETDATEKRVQSLIDQKAQRLITDDVPRLRKKLGRITSNAKTFKDYFGSFTLIFSTILSLLASKIR